MRVEGKVMWEVNEGRRQSYMGANEGTRQNYMGSKLGDKAELRGDQVRRGGRAVWGEVVEEDTYGPSIEQDVLWLEAQLVDCKLHHCIGCSHLLYREGARGSL